MCLEELLSFFKNPNEITKRFDWWGCRIGKDGLRKKNIRNSRCKSDWTPTLAEPCKFVVKSGRGFRFNRSKWSVSLIWNLYLKKKKSKYELAKSTVQLFSVPRRTRLIIILTHDWVMALLKSWKASAKVLECQPDFFSFQGPVSSSTYDFFFFRNLHSNSNRMPSLAKPHKFEVKTGRGFPFKWSKWSGSLIWKRGAPKY